VWKKEEGLPVQAAVVPVTSPEVSRPPVARSGQATIGPSIVIRGEVSGNEDLLIQGQVDGSVALDLHSVTVGGGGRVKADIAGRVITVEGTVEGNLRAKEQIILRGSSTVHGDLKAPRVVLEDGASFRGLVDMGAREVAATESHPTEKAAARPAAGTPQSGSRPSAPLDAKPDAAPGKVTSSVPTRPGAKGNDASERGVAS
jgi:cytoskeletal protein CcmA (bactofilin family)